MIDREDGPIKHYRMKCNLCGKQTKRFPDEFWFERDAPPGWKEIEDGNEDDGTHHCPKCAPDAPAKASDRKTEILRKVGDGMDISDHGAVHRPLVRKADGRLVIDMQDGCKLVITSDTPITVEQIEV